MFGASEGKLRSFAKDARGNVALLFAFSLIPLLIGVGVAVDYGRALIVRERMNDAADAAALAIGSWPGLTQDELKIKAQQFFDANYPPTSLGTVGKLNVNFIGDEKITVTVSGMVPTTFMQLANINSVDVGAASTINKKERNIELVLVLDTTGSMKGSKLTAMKSAAKKMVETLFDGKSTSDTLKIAVVPYSVAVNIGSDKLDSGWLDKATYSSGNASSHPLAFEDLDKTNGMSALELYKKIGKSWTGCVRERDGSAYELTDAPPTSGTPASLFVPYFAPDEPDDPDQSGVKASCSSNSSYDGDYNNSYLADGSISSVTCVKGPTSPKANSDNNKRQCNTAKYKSFTCSGQGPDYNCPPSNSKITPMTNTKNTITNAIDALAANGNTVIPAGLLWGWRVLSPASPFTEGSTYTDEKWVKAIVLLTDGENDVGQGGNGIDESVYNAFGYAKNGHLGNTNGSNANATLDAKTLTVCSAIKNVIKDPDKAIRLYTIGFQVSSASQTLLKSCASKPDMFYNSPTNDQLAAIFQDIAQGLSELRIAQ